MAEGCIGGAQHAADGAIIARRVTMRIKRRGIETRLVIEGTEPTKLTPDGALVKAIARAHRWAEALVTGKAASTEDIARRDGVTARYVRRLLPLAFLAPGIVEAIAHGRQPVELTTEALTRTDALPLDWTVQRQQLGFI